MNFSGKFSNILWMSPSRFFKTGVKFWLYFTQISYQELLSGNCSLPKFKSLESTRRHSRLTRRVYFLVRGFLRLWSPMGVEWMEEGGGGDEKHKILLLYLRASWYDVDYSILTEYESFEGAKYIGSRRILKTFARFTVMGTLF